MSSDPSRNAFRRRREQGSGTTSILRNNPADAPGVLLAAVTLSALGALLYNVLPLFLGAAQDYRVLSEAAAGTLASSFFVGFTFSAASAFFWIHRFNWRAVTSVSVPIAAAAIVLTGFARSFPVMMATVFIAGGAFSVMYSIGTAVIGDSSHPSRWFGLKIAAEAAMGALLLAVLPGAVIARWGFGGLMLALAAAIVVCSPLLYGLPTHSGKGGGGEVTKPAGPPSSKARIPVWFGLFAGASYIFCTTMIWSQLERFAAAAGFDAVTTGKVLSLSLLFAMAGSLLAAIVSGRFGLAKPLLLAGTSVLLSLSLLSAASSVSEFAAAVFLFSLAFGLGLPFFISTIAALDVTGRHVVLTVPALGIGVLLAPATGGILSGSGGFAPVLALGGLTATIAILLALSALHLGRPGSQLIRKGE
jgi:MFS family permease